MNEAYAPIMTEGHEIVVLSDSNKQPSTSKYNPPIHFTGKNKSHAVIKVAQQVNLNVAAVKRQDSFDSNFIDDEHLLPPNSSRARSTSQYYHRLDEQSH